MHGRRKATGTCARIAVLLVALAVAAADRAGAQVTESLHEPIGTHAGDMHAATGAGTFAIPDAPVVSAAPAEPRFFTLRPSLALLLDWTGFHQDDTSIAQVGAQQDKAELRSARLQLFGTIGRDYRVSYQVGGEYKGFDGDPDTTWNLTDLSLTFPLGRRSKVQVGKTKQTFAYEMVGDAANLPQAERVLSPFFVSRNTGVRFTHVWGPAKRGTFSAGMYNDAWDIGTANPRGVDLSARVTALLWDEPEANRFLHLGLAWRHVAAKGELRYRGRPGSNVASNFVDTGTFAADSATHLGIEALLNIGPVSVLAEHVTAEVDAPTISNPTFRGWHVVGSWVLTGETRPYDRNVGYARRVIPTGRWGAPELVARFGRTNLTDGSIDGGAFERLDLGLNWWATTRWKAGVHWGHVTLDRAGSSGRTNTLLTRLQWIY